MTTKLEFILFYSLFVLFVVQLSGMAGQTIFADSPAFTDVPMDELSILNPLTNFGFWVGLLTISTEYQILFSLVMLPLIIGLVWSLVELARGI